MIKLICVIPVYNEQECIEEVVKSWMFKFNDEFSELNYKIILINDGSKDNTGEILDKLGNQYAQLVIVHQGNGGHGNAVLNGYKKAIHLNSEFIFQVDSDNQFSPDDFDKLWNKRNESKFITGFRKKRYDDFNRLIITRILRLVNLIFFKTFINDSNVPFRLIKTNYLKNLIEVLGFEPFAPNIFLAVLAKRDGQDLFEIPEVHKERETGQVSIIKMRLLKVCFRSFKELVKFSLSAKSKLKKLSILNEKN